MKPNNENERIEAESEESSLQEVSSNYYSSLLRTAISDAEKIASGIKDKARSEAEEEAARIIEPARLELKAIKQKAETVAREEAQRIIFEAKQEAAKIEIEAKEKAFQFMVAASQAIEKEISEEYRLALSRLSAYLEDMSSESQKTGARLKSRMARLAANKPGTLPLSPTPGIVEEPVAAAKEEPPEKNSKKQPEAVERENPAVAEIDKQELYTGEVELLILPPVDTELASQFYNYLQILPGLKVGKISGSREDGTTVVIYLEKPLTLIKTVTGIRGMVVTVRSLQKDGTPGKANPLPKRGDKAAQRLDLILERERMGPVSPVADNEKEISGDPSLDTNKENLSRDINIDQFVLLQKAYLKNMSQSVPDKGVTPEIGGNKPISRK